MKPRYQTSISLSLSLFLALAVCEAKELTTPSPYPVMDSGVWADPLHSPTIHWLDNQRVIFKGTEATKKSEAYRWLSLRVWDTEGNTIKTHANNTKGIVCYHDGTILYWIDNDQEGNKRYGYGELGKEKVLVFPKTAKLHTDMNCRLSDVESVVKQRKGRAIRLLLDRHGYLDLGMLGDKDNNPQVRLHRFGQDEGIALPLRAYDISQASFHEFRDAYFIWSNVQRRDGPSTVWWLSFDGAVTEIAIPPGPWTKGGSAAAIPTRVGTFITYHGYKSPTDPGPAGGYLVQGEKYHQVIAGLIQGPVVSPNGCKVAFVHHFYPAASSASDPRPVTLKMIDFCIEEKRHGRQ